jgi:hypothetical protein
MILTDTIPAKPGLARETKSSDTAAVRITHGWAAMDVADWLRKLGLEQYEPAFRANEIDARVLPNLTAEDLKKLGVNLVGHRRRLLDAIAALRAPTAGSRLPTLPRLWGREEWGPTPSGGS